MAPCEFFDVDAENEIETEDFEPEDLDGPTDIHIITKDELETKEFIDIYIINRNHIREQSKSVIPACGFLLTGAFGLIYFIFRENSDKNLINWIIIVILVLASMVLAASILTSIKSVQAASSSMVLPRTKYQQLDFLIDIYNDEYKFGNYSIWLLRIALFLFVIIIIYFSWQYLADTPSTHSVQSIFPRFIVIPLPRLF